MNLDLEIKFSNQTDEHCEFCGVENNVQMSNIGQVQYALGQDFNVCDGCLNEAFQKYADNIIAERCERRSHLLFRRGPLFNECERRGI